MRKFVCAGVLVLVLVGLAFGQPYRQFDLPKFLEPPTLDGDRFTVADEWANASGPHDCSPEAIIADAEQFGWLDQATKNTVVSHDQLGTSESEDGAIAMTNMDKRADAWFAWDDDGLYWIHEIRDNSRDSHTDGNPETWWERDSVSIYIDLTEANEESSPYVSMNIVNMVAAPITASGLTVTWERTEAGARSPTQDPDLIADIDYGFRDAGNEFGGEEDYVIEGTVPWDTFMMFNLPAVPEVGTIMGWSIIHLDPDVDPGYGGQLQCLGHADNPITFADWLFTDNPAGPGSPTVTAVEENSWGRIKSTFN
jgi:hypothetical protein